LERSRLQRFFQNVVLVRGGYAPREKSGFFAACLVA
jgi:hypothetical protein